MHGKVLLLWINGICQPKICIFSSVLWGVNIQHTNVLTTHQHHLFSKGSDPWRSALKLSLFCLNSPTIERNCSLICNQNKAVHQQPFLVYATQLVLCYTFPLCCPLSPLQLEQLDWVCLRLSPGTWPCWRCTGPTAQCWWHSLGLQRDPRKAAPNALENSALV